MWKRISLLWALIRGDARRLWFAVRHPAAPWWLKAGTLLVLAYALWPLDLIPETIPLLGVVDDIVLIAAVVRFMLGRLPPQMRDDVERRAGAPATDNTPRS